MAFLLLASPPAVAGGRGEHAFERAAELHGDERWDEAAAAFIAAYEAGYRQPVSAYNAACGLARAGRKDEAFRWLERAREAGFDLEPYLRRDDDLRSLRGDPRLAALSGTRLEKEEEAEGDHDALARQLYNSGRYREASRAFVRAAVRADNPATALYNAACSRALQGHTEAALELLQRAVEEGFTDTGHLDADDDLDSIRDQPRFRQIYEVARQAGRPRPAPTQTQGFDGSRWFGLGYAHVTGGRPEQAIAAFEHAIELGYRVATSMYNLACAHALAGNREEAFTWLDRAIAAGFDRWSLLRQDDDLESLRDDPRFGRYLDRD
jgi:tetratricopeptide (TPR) repeat protein